MGFSEDIRAIQLNMATYKDGNAICTLARSTLQKVENLKTEYGYNYRWQCNLHKCKINIAKS
jgi:hypothetical protein